MSLSILADMTVETKISFDQIIDHVAMLFPIMDWRIKVTENNKFHNSSLINNIVHSTFSCASRTIS